MKYGQAIRLVRAARNLSRQGLATRANLDPSYISLLESEKRAPSEDALNAIVAALGVPDSLLKLLAAESAELQGINEADAALLGKQLVTVLISTPSGGGGRGK